MNELMKNLIDQARKKPLGDSWTYCSPLEFEERLVELIIQECVDICMNENVSNLDMDIIRSSDKLTVQDLATRSCGENLSKLIKKRFGVV